MIRVKDWKCSKCGEQIDFDIDYHGFDSVEDFIFNASTFGIEFDCCNCGKSYKVVVELKENEEVKE